MHLVRTLIIATLLMVGVLTAGETPVTLRVTPHIGLAPLTVELQAHIDPHPDNSAMVLEIDGADYFALSRYDLDPDSPSVFTMRYPSIPAGTYYVYARLYRHVEGKRGLVVEAREVATAAQEVTAVGPGGGG